MVFPSIPSIGKCLAQSFNIDIGICSFKQLSYIMVLQPGLGGSIIIQIKSSQGRSAVKNFYWLFFWHNHIVSGWYHLNNNNHSKGQPEKGDFNFLFKIKVWWAYQLSHILFILQFFHEHLQWGRGFYRTVNPNCQWQLIDQQQFNFILKFKTVN